MKNKKRKNQTKKTKKKQQQQHHTNKWDIVKIPSSATRPVLMSVKMEAFRRKATTTTKKQFQKRNKSFLFHQNNNNNVFVPSFYRVFFFRLATERNGDQFHDMEHEKKSSHHRRTRAQKKKRKRIDPAAVEFVADRIENPVEKLGTRRPMAALSHASIQWHPPIPDNVIGPQSPAHRRTFQIPKLVAPQKRNPEKKNSVKLGNGSLRTIRRGKPNADAGKLGKKNSVNKKPTLTEHAVRVSASNKKGMPQKLGKTR